MLVSLAVQCRIAVWELIGRQPPDLPQNVVEHHFNSFKPPTREVQVAEPYNDKQKD